jgi:hypothetical protein
MLTQGKRAVLAAGIAASCFMFSIEIAQARCSVPRFNFRLGEPTSTTITADSGARCIIKLRESNVSIFKSIVTVQRPAKGSLTALNPLNIAYQSRPGYQGQDSFAFKIVGTRNGAPLTTHATVTVTVTGGYGPGAPPAAAAPPARQAARSGRQAVAPNALRDRCLQDAGAGRDPVTGRMQFYLNHPSRMDRYKLCLAGGDRAKANSIAVPEISRVHPGDRGPTYRAR